MQNEIDKTCKWMASDYAIEFTRRQFGVTTSDSRYDDATFILCLKNTFKSTVGFINGNCLAVEVSVGSIVAGDTITITNAANSGNNLTSKTVAGAVSYGYITYLFFTGLSLVNEQAAAITISATHSSLTNVPAYFIDSRGAILMLAEDMLNAADGDTWVIGNSTYSNGTCTINKIYAPVAADGNNNYDFPQIIYPATAMPNIPGNFIFEYNVTINDTTNQFYAVEQGIENGTNILSPATVMNYRISPAHAAMRHYRNIVTDRQYATENLIFTGGTGNFYALGRLTDSCSPENGNISEGGNLSLANFTVPDDGKPLFYPELIKFEYPLTWAQFLQIQANPYGLIQFEHANDGVQQGWLTDLQYHPYTGLAEFSVYPKI